MIDIEIALAKAFHWSLYDIDRTDIGSLIPFFLHYVHGKNSDTKTTTYCDEVDWL